MAPQKQDSLKENFEVLCVIEFSSKCPQATIEWLISKISSSLDHGGADLLVKVTSYDDQRDTVAFVSGRTKRLLEAAEVMEIRKMYNDGAPREISLKDIDQYKGGDHLETFLTSAEKSRIVQHELEAIRALNTDEFMPGYKNTKLYEGQAIVPVCVKEGIIEQMFPLHNKQELEDLGNKWWKAFWKPQPISEIRKYFGATVAMYFAFLGFYTTSLVPPAAIAMASFFLETNDILLQWFFCVFNMVWVTIFIETWKRHSSVLAFRWGTYHLEKFEEARPQYFGVLMKNFVTGRKEPVYPKWKRLCRFYLVSVPIVMLCLAYSVWAMVTYFKLQDTAERYHSVEKSTWSGLVSLSPTVLYSLVIMVSNIIYQYLAEFLNNFENHRLQSSYENHLIVKLCLFYSFNSFCSLFYIAFYLQDLHMLRRDLGTLLITMQIVNQFQEILLPLSVYTVKKFLSKKHMDLNGATIKISDPLLQQVDDESNKEQYTEMSALLTDYLEMYLQFGYVFLFSAAFPTAAFWALLNNLTEIRSDSFKLCSSFQRPFAKPAEGMGAWLLAFEAMNILAVITNTILIAISPKAQEIRVDVGDANFIIAFVAIEHGLFLIRFLLAVAIPDQPGFVRNAIARTEYRAKQAWIKERLEVSKSVSLMLKSSSSEETKKTQ